MPIHCAVPPHIMRSVVERGNVLQRDRAWRALMVSEDVREQRREARGGPSEVAERAEAMPASGVERATTSGRGRVPQMVYSAEGESSLPGRLIRGREAGPCDDVAANEAYEAARLSADFFSEVFGRDSIDNAGMVIESTVHYMRGYDNAFWNGRQMVYGDGDEDLDPDERLWTRFTVALEVVAHELSHGIIQHETNLLYRNQSGALHESFADVFGILVRQKQVRHTAEQADWLIGRDLLTARVQGIALRSFKAPGTAYDDPILGRDLQPAHMRDYCVLQEWEDHGGVHINSGIANRAFYLTAIALGGYAWERAGHIWYYALCHLLVPTADFLFAAKALSEAAARLYGRGSREQIAVWEGWAQVGIDAGQGDGR